VTVPTAGWPVRDVLSLLVVVLALCACATASSSAANAPPKPASLAIALNLGHPLLQAGVVRGPNVILARGFEVELARVLARRLGTRVARFAYVPSARRLLAGGTASWQLAVAGIERTASRGARLSAPYLTTDVAVVTRRGLERPRRLADLRSAVACATRGSTGATVLASLRLRTPPLLVAGRDRLRDLLRTGACDVALVAAFETGRLVGGHRAQLGPVVGRIRYGDGLGVVVRPGAGYDVASVNAALAQLRRDGTLARLARSWLGLDPAALPRLR